MKKSFITIASLLFLSTSHINFAQPKQLPPHSQAKFDACNEKNKKLGQWSGIAFGFAAVIPLAHYLYTPFVNFLARRRMDSANQQVNAGAHTLAETGHTQEYDAALNYAQDVDDRINTMHGMLDILKTLKRPAIIGGVAIGLWCWIKIASNAYACTQEIIDEEMRLNEMNNRPSETRWEVYARLFGSQNTEENNQDTGQREQS